MCEDVWFQPLYSSIPIVDFIVHWPPGVVAPLAFGRRRRDQRAVEATRTRAVADAAARSALHETLGLSQKAHGQGALGTESSVNMR